jgi:hypothetical protein
MGSFFLPCGGSSSCFAPAKKYFIFKVLVLPFSAGYILGAVMTPDYTAIISDETAPVKSFLQKGANFLKTTARAPPQYESDR